MSPHPVTDASDALLATSAQEHAFTGGVIAIAVLILILAAAELVGRSRQQRRSPDPHVLTALALATVWVIARALSDSGGSAALQLFLALVAALGILVGTAYRPARLLAGVTAIVVLPEFSMVVATAARSEAWTVGEGVFWGSLIAGLSLTPLLVAFSITVGAVRLSRVLRAPGGAA